MTTVLQYTRARGSRLIFGDIFFFLLLVFFFFCSYTSRRIGKTRPVSPRSVRDGWKCQIVRTIFFDFFLTVITLTQRGNFWKRTNTRVEHTMARQHKSRLLRPSRAEIFAFLIFTIQSIDYLFFDTSTCIGNTKYSCSESCYVNLPERQKKQ